MVLAESDVRFRVRLRVIIDSAAVSDLMKSNHIPFGAIFIAATGDGPDAAWMLSAERNIDAIRALKMTPPDHLVFATRYSHPTKNLPETSPEAFTHLIDYYFVGR